jgi:hypothetical protein
VIQAFMFVFLLALGWYQSFFWGTFILQGSRTPYWRFARDVFGFMVAPLKGPNHHDDAASDGRS